MPNSRGWEAMSRGVAGCRPSVQHQTCKWWILCVSTIVTNRTKEAEQSRPRMCRKCWSSRAQLWSLRGVGTIKKICTDTVGDFWRSARSVPGQAIKPVASNIGDRDTLSRPYTPNAALKSRRIGPCTDARIDNARRKLVKAERSRKPIHNNWLQLYR